MKKTILVAVLQIGTWALGVSPMMESWESLGFHTRSKGSVVHHAVPFEGRSEFGVFVFAPARVLSFSVRLERNSSCELVSIGEGNPYTAAGGPRPGNAPTRKASLYRYESTRRGWMEHVFEVNGRRSAETTSIRVVFAPGRRGRCHYELVYQPDRWVYALQNEGAGPARTMAAPSSIGEETSPLKPGDKIEEIFK